MEDPFFRYYHPTPPLRKSRTRSIPVSDGSNPNPKPGPNPDPCARKIQALFRGHRVRKWVRRVMELRREAEGVQRGLLEGDGMEGVRRDEMERLRVSESLMRLLIKLDGVKGFDCGVRELRKGVVRKVVVLQEIVDSIGRDGREGFDVESVGSGNYPEEVAVSEGEEEFDVANNGAEGINAVSDESLDVETLGNGGTEGIVAVSDESLRAKTRGSGVSDWNLSVAAFNKGVVEGIVVSDGNLEGKTLENGAADQDFVVETLGRDGAEGIVDSDDEEFNVGSLLDGDGDNFMMLPDFGRLGKERAGEKINPSAMKVEEIGDEDVAMVNAVGGDKWECVKEEEEEEERSSLVGDGEVEEGAGKAGREDEEWLVVGGVKKEEVERSESLFEKMAEDYRKLMAMVAEQTKVICSLSRRVEHLEKAVNDSLRRKKNKKNGPFMSYF